MILQWAKTWTLRTLRGLRWRVGSKSPCKHTPFLDSLVAIRPICRNGGERHPLAVMSMPGERHGGEINPTGSSKKCHVAPGLTLRSIIPCIARPHKCNRQMGWDPILIASCACVPKIYSNPEKLNPRSALSGIALSLQVFWRLFSVCSVRRWRTRMRLDFIKKEAYPMDKM